MPIETPTPPCERLCNNTHGRCVNYLRCSEWREWFATEWAKACATIAPYIEHAKGEPRTNDQETAQSV